MKILFFGGGSFEGLPEIFSKKMHRPTRRTMGLRATNETISCDPQRDYEILAEAPSEIMIEALIEYGYVPEFAGRFPVVVPLAPLTKEEMRRALTEPKNAVIRQQKELFKRDGIELIVPEQTLDAIVNKAVSIKTGVRALRSLVKHMTSVARFDLSADPVIAKVEIGPECLDTPSSYKATRKTSAQIELDLNVKEAV